MSQHTVLIVDDEQDILEEYEGIFGEHPINIQTTVDAQKAINILSSDNITVLVTDQKMPQMTGLQLVEKAKEVSPDTIRIILTGYAEQDLILEAINVGRVFRFLTKPCDPEEFVSTILDAVDYYKEREKAQKLVNSRGTYRDANSDLDILQTQLEEREAEIQMLVAEQERKTSGQQDSFKAIFTFLVSIIRLKNDTLFKNGKWVAEFSTKIARVMKLSEQDQNLLRLASYLKNFGLILLSDVYTEKPFGLLNSDELRQYYRFPVLGEQILKKLPGLNKVSELIGNQLERFDGSGPGKKSDQEIPLLSQIISVADDACKILSVRSNNPKRETVYGKTYLINHLRKNQGKMYSSKIVNSTVIALNKG